MTGTEADRALGSYLRSLRQAAGLDPAVLARRLSLSTAQLLQLEEGERSLFYTPGIRMQAARKLITHLGGDLSALENAPAAGPPPSAPAPQPAQEPVPAPVVALPDAVPQTPSKETTAARPVLVGGLLLSGLLFALAFFAGRPAPPAATSVASAGASPAPAAAAQAVAVAVPEPPAAPPARELPAAAAPAAQAAEPAQGPAIACQPPLADAAVFRPLQARKPGDMVYLVSGVEQVVCVTDGNGQQQARSFKAGQGLSFYGPPPWQLQSSQWGQTQLYFQGWKVQLPAVAPEVIRLVEWTELADSR